MPHSNTNIISEIEHLKSKYKNLQDLYYDMYLMSFTDTDDTMYYEHICLYRKFKEVCRLLNQVKSLVDKTSQQRLGIYEIKVLLEHPDIKKIINKYKLYPTIESNYEEF